MSSVGQSTQQNGQMTSNQRKRGTDEPLEAPKKRAAVACENCRSRKSRCDGAKPACGFCADRRIDCIYQEPGLKLDTGDRLILASIARLTELVHERVGWSAPVLGTGSSPDVRPPSASPPPRGRTQPPIALDPAQTPQMESLVSRPLSAHHLLLDEQTRPAFEVGDALSLEFSDNAATVRAFFDHVNIWYAIVDWTTWDATYQAAAAVHFREGPESCLVLLVLALGKAGAAANDSSGDAIMAHGQDPPGMPYLSAAWTLLASLLVNRSIIASQCVILAAIYLLRLGRPLETWTLLGSIAAKLHLHLLARAQALDELSKRVVWNFILLEADIIAELQLPPSALASYILTLDLPADFPSAPAATGPPEDMSYLTANITLLRLQVRTSHALAAAPALAAPDLDPLILALDTDLSTWHTTHLNPLAAPSAPQTLLCYRYHATRARIFQHHLLLSLAGFPPSPSSDLPFARASLESTIAALHHFHTHRTAHFPHVWRSALITARLVMIAVAAAEQDGLRHTLEAAEQDALPGKDAGAVGEPMQLRDVLEATGQAIHLLASPGGQGGLQRAAQVVTECVRRYINL